MKPEKKSERAVPKSVAAGGEEQQTTAPAESARRGRPYDSGLFGEFDPKTVELRKSMIVALLGKLAGTSGEQVLEWLRLNLDRQQFIHELNQAWNYDFAPGTREGLHGLSNWFSEMRRQKDALTWEGESTREVHERSAVELGVRSILFDFQTHVDHFSTSLLEETRTAILRGDSAYFRDIAKMIDMIKSRGSQLLQAEHVMHVILCIIAEERQARDAVELAEERERNLKELVESGNDTMEERIRFRRQRRPDNGLNAPTAHQGDHTADELHQEVNKRLMVSRDQEAKKAPDKEASPGLYSEKAIRRWAEKLGYTFKKDKTGRPKGRQNTPH